MHSRCLVSWIASALSRRLAMRVVSWAGPTRRLRSSGALDPDHEVCVILRSWFMQDAEADPRFEAVGAVELWQRQQQWGSGSNTRHTDRQTLWQTLRASAQAQKGVSAAWVPALAGEPDNLPVPPPPLARRRCWYCSRACALPPAACFRRILCCGCHAATGAPRPRPGAGSTLRRV